MYKHGNIRSVVSYDARFSKQEFKLIFNQNTDTENLMR